LHGIEELTNFVARSFGVIASLDRDRKQVTGGCLPECDRILTLKSGNRVGDEPHCGNLSTNREGDN
jgi:hypothetical protein